MKTQCLISSTLAMRTTECPYSNIKQHNNYQIVPITNTNKNTTTSITNNTVQRFQYTHHYEIFKTNSIEEKRINFDEKIQLRKSELISMKKCWKQNTERINVIYNTHYSFMRDVWRFDVLVNCEMNNKKKERSVINNIN